MSEGVESAAREVGTRTVKVLSRGVAADVLEVVRGGRAAVVKVLRETASLEDRERFANELDVLASVRHDNVVRIDRVVADGEGVRAIVMPKLVGRSLRQWLASFGPLPPPIAIFFFADVLAGLSALHERGIVHRDVKPSNLFIGREAHERPTTSRGILIDLGLATTRRPLTTSRHIVGSIRYLAPEQVLAGRLDARTDVWGAGVSLYEALTGRPAFPSDDPLAILAHDPLAKSAGHFGRGRRALEPFLDVLRRSIATRPDDRFPTVDAMRAALLEDGREVSR